MQKQTMNSEFQRTMRWYGPDDPVSLDIIRQAGASGIVTALHQIPPGEVWSKEDITERKQIIEDSPAGRLPLKWTVVESVDVHEDIKSGSPERDRLIKNYQETLRNLADHDIRIVCYNFMPVLDWMRTDQDHELNTGAKTIGFSQKEAAAFDLFIYKRKNADRDYTDEVLKKAEEYFNSLDTKEKKKLETNCLGGLPGTGGTIPLADFKRAVAPFRELSREQVQENLIYFLEQVVPVAEEVGIRLAIHPDDPPFPVFGIPRVVSTYEDLKTLLKAVDSDANGLTLCTGSLGSRADNDLVKMAKDFASKVYFIHGRNVAKEADGSFMESGHIDGDVDIIEVLLILVEEQERRAKQGRKDALLPIRPDHGFLMLDDIKKEYYHGYSPIGRLKGMAELRGLETVIRRYSRVMKRLPEYK